MLDDGMLADRMITLLEWRILSYNKLMQSAVQCEEV
jgi:hypothetical protein